jgi:tetratricopeptide (TPR) repeat protein
MTDRESGHRQRDGIRSAIPRLLSVVWRGALALVLTAGFVMSAGLFSGGTNSSPKKDDPESLLGNYLAGRQARFDRDTTSAADFYEKALAMDPDNEVILEQTFLLEAAAAHWPRAVSLATKLVETEKLHRIARLVLAVDAFRKGDYAEAESHLRSARKGPISDLTTSLGLAWVKLAAGDPDAAFATLNEMKKAEWAQFYRRYHKGLIASLARRHDIADKSLSQAFNKNNRTRRIAEAYAREAANSGDTKLAARILRTHMAKTSRNAMIEALLAEIEEGKKVDLLIGSAADGFAEVFYGIGDALTGEGGVEIGTIYLQLALQLRPGFALVLRSLGEVYDATRNYELAISSYDRVPQSSPLWMNTQIRKAYDLNSLERTDEAVALLESLAEAKPGETRPLDALGSILRSHKRYEEAAKAYSRAIALVKKPDKNHWALFYARGVCHERLKQWPKAEADLKRALELSPDQPLVLNYLGYSWVDQGQNLDEAMSLIRKAVDLKPDDGYFVDSLGWARYRLGNYQEATKQLERAVELRPDDPVINDHLGDAYWRVNRKLEARYQWSQSLTLEPEPEEVEKIKTKLAEGLPEPKEIVVASRSGEATDTDVTVKVKDREKVAVVGTKPEELKEAVEEAVKPRVHVVKEGQTLWGLAQEYYGDGMQFGLIYRANQSLIKDPNRIYHGQKLQIPEQQ